MNREIKFRVWDIDNLRMFKNCFKLTNKGFETWVQLEKQSSDNLIWLQYTGLKDKCGQEIHEGDIVKWKQAKGGVLLPVEETYICQIEWSISMNGWRCRLLNQPDHCGFTFASCHIEINRKHLSKSY